MRKLIFLAGSFLAVTFVFALAMENTALWRTQGDILEKVIEPETSAHLDLPSPPVIDGKLWIPVIVYHRINYSPKNANSVYKSLTIEPEWFEKHLQYLKENGFETIHFDDIAAYFDYAAPLPARPVLINFDDGYRDTYENALPILQKYNMTGTVFVVPNLVGKKAYVTWEMVIKLRDAGMEIGSHTMWHPNLTRSKKAEWEIFESKKTLEEKLGLPVSAFAYPEGKYNETVQGLVKAAGYKTARTFSTGNGISEKNRFEIPVVRVYANVGLARWKSQLFPP